MLWLNSERKGSGLLSSLMVSKIYGRRGVFLNVREEGGIVSV